MQINSATAIRIILGMIGGFFLILLGVGIGLYPTEGKARELTPISAYCPTEDSCRLDYHNGHWYAIPIVP